MQYTIRKANTSDLKSILSLAEENSLASAPLEDAQKKGFLVSAFDEEVYAEYINKNKYFFVVEAFDRVQAFLLGFSDTELDYKLIVNQELRKQAQAPFFVVKQICVSHQLKGKGIAKSLYKHIESETGFKDFFAAIVLEPLNQGSIAFHEACGYKEDFQIRPEDNQLRAIYRKKIS